MSRYGFEESIRDGATLPLHFEPRLVELHIDQEAIDEAYAELTGGLSDLDRETLARAASKMAVLVKVPERIEAICADIAHHFQEKVAPNGFKGMVVTFDQESCLLYKAALDQHLPPEASEIVISVSGKEREDERYRPLKRDRDAEEKLLDRYPRPQRPAANPDRHRQAADRLRRAHPAGHVPGQAAARPHPAPGHHPHQPHLRRQEDPRPDRRLPGRLRRRGQVAGVRRRGLPPGRLRHREAQGAAARRHAEVPGLLRRRRPHASAATRA